MSNLCCNLGADIAKQGFGSRGMEFGICLPSSFEAVRQAQLAEALGFAFIGFFDSPALEPDVWITIANAAQATKRIKVGTEVLVPHLRHPMAQACAIATVEHLAPGRIYVGVGTGFTGRKAMGQRPLSWAFIVRFLTQVRGLLAGEEVSIDGALTKMLHPRGFAPPRPLRIPFLVAANGPKGIDVAREHGDGLIYGGAAEPPQGFSVLQLLLGAILLDDGESPTSPRVLEAAKPTFAMQYHLAYEGYFNPPILLERLPYGDDWRDSIGSIPVEVRHLHVHEEHMVGLNAHDAAFADRHPDALAAHAASLAVTPGRLQERLAALTAFGPSRINCGVSFNDWEADMRRYARALGL
jgi:5,10-methylenetetrahydromethanopterin reductase